MKKLFLASLVLLVTGCAIVVQTASISEAYENYADKDYAETLKLISRAEHISETAPELKAELTYLRAQTYEEMGQYETAETLYEYLKDKHNDSQYGYLAAEWLGQNDGSVK